MSSGSEASLRRLQWIQILRGIAASSVVLHHAIYYAFTRGGQGDGSNGNSVFAAGVDLFFIISGFVMMMVSDPDHGRESRPSAFIFSRITRIVPLYWLFTIILAAGALAFPWIMRSTMVSGETILKSLLFIPFFQPNGNLVPVLGVGWTLNYEMGFYAVFAALLRVGIRARVPTMALIFLALFIIGKMLGADNPIGVFLGHSITFEFVAGMALYLLYRRGVRASPVQVIGLLVFAVLTFGWTAVSGPPSLDARFFLWGLPALAVVVAALSLPDVKGGLGRFLERIGDASYSTYLSHQFVIAVLFIALGHAGGAPPVIFIFVAVLVALAAGLLSYRIVELPLLRMARGQAARLRRRPT
jgi:exopolysaccharide production protein ExoZ